MALCSIQIHMINLYQRVEITKERIKREDLKKCRLALWFCTWENGIFRCVSSVFHSNEITDSNIQDILIFNPLKLFLYYRHEK